jgi:hypothetical protein
MSKIRLGVAALALICGVGAAAAQNSTQPPSGDTARPAENATPTPGNTTSDQSNPSQGKTDATEDRTNVKNNTPPLSGANSFTETQARDRLAAAGFQEVKDLKKDDQGVWRAVAKKGDTQVNVALDFKGNVVQE